MFPPLDLLNQIKLFLAAQLPHTRLMNILPCKTADSNRNLTARAGLVVLADLFKHLGINELVDRFMPAPSSNRG